MKIFKYKKKVCKSIVFIGIAAILFAGLMEFFRTSNLSTTASINGFYKEPENTLDVMFIGASEVYSDYCAAEAWKEYGYTSYSLGCASVPGSMYKSMLKETLDRQNPQLVVFEINGFIINDERFHDQVSQHRWIDDMKWNQNKWDTITETIAEEDRKSFYLPFAFYHNNWKDPVWCAGNVGTRLAVKLAGPTSLKGFSSFANESEGTLKKAKKLYFTEDSQKALKDLLEYCKDSEVPNVLFVRFPHQKKVKNPEVYDQIEEMICSYGYKFKNFEKEKEDIGLDAKADYYNAEHLNINGSRKFTNYIGEYITSNYEISTEHEADVEKNWLDSYESAMPLLKKCVEDTRTNSGNHYYEPMIYLP